MDERLVVETKNLTKRYGSRGGVVAVENLDLSVRSGEVYGFLGPNGASKTTTIRMLLGLIEPTSGTARVLGQEPGNPEGLRKVGALVESPAFYPYLLGYDNLYDMARLSGVEDIKGRVREALEQVGLKERAKDKYKKYSLGMKQRLGVAAALLKDPELLILDEPTNGLDPKGTAEMRELIRSLGRGSGGGAGNGRGEEERRSRRSVLLSSHLMNEVEQVCSRVGVIREGKLVAEGTVEELRGQSGLLLRAEPAEEAARVAGQIEGVEAIELRDDRAMHLTTDPERASEIGGRLYSEGIKVSEIRPEKRSLEEVFLELTEEGAKEGEAAGEGGAGGERS